MTERYATSTEVRFGSKAGADGVIGPEFISRNYRWMAVDQFVLMRLHQGRLAVLPHNAPGALRRRSRGEARNRPLAFRVDFGDVLILELCADFTADSASAHGGEPILEERDVFASYRGGTQ